MSKNRPTNNTTTAMLRMAEALGHEVEKASKKTYDVGPYKGKTSKDALGLLCFEAQATTTEEGAEPPMTAEEIRDTMALTTISSRGMASWAFSAVHAHTLQEFGRDS